MASVPVSKSMSILSKLAWKKHLAGGLAFAVAVSAIAPADLSARGLIRDAETESLIRDYAKPIFRVAGLGQQNIRIHIVNDRNFNAFVVDGRNMFIHSETLKQSKTPNQLIGVIAHETGHIAGGHLSRLRRTIAKAQSASLMLQILGIAAIVAGAATGGAAGGSAGAAVMSGGQSVTQRAVLAYQRAEESAADQAAVRYLNATKQSSRGMLETFSYFVDQGFASLKYVDPYVQSHPMPQQRIIQLRELARRSPYYDKADNQDWAFRHELMRAKLSGFLESPRTVYTKYPPSDKSMPARYARAVVLFRREKNLKAFQREIDQLIRMDPGNPYFYELKGQFLLEAGQASRAVPPLRNAVKLAPNSGLIRILLAHALLTANQPRLIDEAVTQLRRAIVRENTSPEGYRLLAMAYGRKGLTGQASLASAYQYLYQGKLKFAKEQAKRAQTKFREGTPNWIKADDILKFQPPKLR